MKKNLRPSFIILGMVIMLLASCQDKSSALCRSWKVKDMRYTRKIPEPMKPAIDAKINEIKKALILTYSPDGNYETQFNDKVMHGKWSLNYNSSKISVVTEDGKTVDYTILQLNPSTFNFKAIENHQEVIFEMVPAN